MDNKTVNLKGADELHIKDVGVFFIKDKRAYYADGRPVESDKLRVCQHCQNSPPFVATQERDKRTGLTSSVELVFARHMVEKHPEHAKPKEKPTLQDAIDAKEKKTAKKTAAAPKKAAKKTAKKG